MKIYFVRHGESEANVIREISNRGYKHGLTEKGRAQAAALAQNLKGIGATKIYSSPLKRAVETAQILSEALGIAYEVTDALREFDCGIAEGRPDEGAWNLHRWVYEEWFQHGRYESRIEGGESFVDIQQRFVPFIEELVKEKGNTQESLILIGHGATYMAMLSRVLCNVGEGFASTHGLANTEYILAEMRPEGLMCLEWCGIPMEGRSAP